MATITVTGNLTGQPELKLTNQSQAVCSFMVAENHRKRDASGQWVDDEPTFYRCTAWRELAENCADSLTKGTRVIVTGRLQAREYQTKTGETRQSLDLQVDEIGPSLRYAKATVQRAPRNQGGGQTMAAKAADQWGQALNPAAGITQAAPNCGQWDTQEPPF